MPDEQFRFHNVREFEPIKASLEHFQISETNKAISKLKNNKAAGVDEILAELLKQRKQRGEQVTEALAELFNRI